MKRTLEEALNGRFDFLSGVVQGYTCDVACGVFNIWEKNIGNGFYHMLPLPYLDNGEARTFFRESLQGMISVLKQSGGDYSEQHLTHSIKLYSSIREKIRTCDLSACSLYKLYRAAELLPPEELLPMLNTLEGHAADTSESGDSGIPVMISGSLIEDESVYQVLESLGARVVVNDTCNGDRINRNPIPLKKGQDSLEWIIERHFGRYPCPCRSRAEERLQRMIEDIKAFGVRGVLFIVQTFCTPHLSDIPFLSKELKKLGIANTTIELDESWNVEGQFRTRLEGFLETIT